MIYLGADHRGFQLKEKIKSWLSVWAKPTIGGSSEHFVKQNVVGDIKYEDCGAFEYDKEDDYPDFAKAVAEKVAASENNKGILICGSGVGVAIVANKIKGIRAGTAANTEQVKASVSDEDLNVLAISADYTDGAEAQDIIKTFLETKFSGAERHIRRVNKIRDLEK